MSLDFFLILLGSSFFLEYLIREVSLKFSIFLDEKEKPQKLHLKPIPRIGGLPLYLSILGLGGYLFFTKKDPLLLKVGGVLSMATLVGIWEDYRGASYKIRFIGIILSSILGIFLLSSYLQDLRFVYLPIGVAIFLAIFALTGITNAYNIIDGLNGLSSGAALILFFFYSLLAEKYGISPLEEYFFYYIAILLGFFLWNYPWGKIFLGDSGSYFIGLSVGLFSILMVKESPKEISFMYPIVANFFPIWETLFAIYRRLKEKKNPFKPDRKHTFQILLDLLSKNGKYLPNVITLFMLLLHTGINLLAYFFHRSSWDLFFIFLGLSILHSIVYSLLLRKVEKSPPKD